MFGFVDVQESFPNINGLETFNKLFKKSHSSLTDSWSISVHNVWVIPGHIIVSVDEGHKLLSFDLLPKPKPWPDVTDFLSAKQVNKKKGQRLAAFEVFCIGLSPQFLFIVMKNAELHVWKFLRPAFEWNFLCKLNLSAGKNIQIVSVCFDPKSKMLFWCERRTTTQCYICKTVVNVNQKDLIGKTSDILHNCPPVQISLVGSGGVLLRPMANCPFGLTMFWSSACNRIQLHIWNSPSNGILPLSASSDFQSLVTDSISLWINNTANDPAAVAYCTHSVTQQLFILESTYTLHSVQIDSEGQPNFKKVCNLDKRQLPELNQRKTYRMFVFQKFLGLFLDDDEFFVFETYKGMLVWSSDSLKNETPRIWIGQGMIPSVGVWSASAVRVLRSESVMKQATTMLKFETKTEKHSQPRERRISREYTLQLTLNIDKGKKQTGNPETYIVVDHEDDAEGKCGTANDNDQSDHTTCHENKANSDSLLLVSEYLRDWKSSNYSSEISHWLLTNPKLNIKENWLQISNEEEFKKIYRIFNNPCVFMALFYENPKYKRFIDDIMKDYASQHANEAIDDVEPELLSLIKQYCSISDERDLILNSGKGKEEDRHAHKRKSWHDTFKSLLQNETIAKQDFFEIMQWATETKKPDFICEILNILGIQIDEDTINNDKCDENMQFLVSKAILRSDTRMFELVCNALWETYPKLLPEFLKKASDSVKLQRSDGFLRPPSRTSLVSQTEVFSRAIKCLTANSWNGKLKDEQIKILAKLLLSGETEDILQASNLYLENRMYSDAIDVLASYADNSDLHYRLFYATITTLIHNKAITDYSQRLSLFIPSNFQLAEFYHVFQGFEDQNEPCDVFISRHKETSFGALEPLLNELLRESPEI